MRTSLASTRTGVALALGVVLITGPLAPARADEPAPSPSPSAGTPAPDSSVGAAAPSPTATASPTASPSATAPAVDDPSTAEPTPTAGPTPEPVATPGPADVPEPSELAPGLLVPAAVLPAGPVAPALAPTPIDAYVPYNPQSTCDPTVKPGAQYLLNLLVSYYGGRRSGITRACSIGGTSEHKEGRAVDWGLNAFNPAERAAGDSFVAWLTAVGPDGRPSYNARRLGVMYVIWNGYIWSNSSERSTVRQYTGSNPHTDHVHISLGWYGARMQTSWWTGVAVASDAELRMYVRAVYRDLFDRLPDPSGLQTWSRALDTGTPRIAVANAITSSTEYRSALIAGAYQDFLDRTPDAGGLANWLSAMGQGLTIQGLEAGFVASDEYFRKAGGTAEGWVQQLYLHVLGRTAGPTEVGWWVAVLNGGASRQSVALGFVLSTERLTTVIGGYYDDLLGRGIDPAGRSTWVSAIQGGSRTEEVIGGIVASEEYFRRAQTS